MLCINQPLSMFPFEWRRRDQDIGKADALLVYPCHDDHPHQVGRNQLDKYKGICQIFF